MSAIWLNETGNDFKIRQRAFDYRCSLIAYKKYLSAAGNSKSVTFPAVTLIFLLIFSLYFVISQMMLL